MTLRYGGSLHRYSAAPDDTWEDFPWDYECKKMMRPVTMFICIEVRQGYAPRLHDLRVTGLALTPDGETQKVPGYRKGEPARELPASVSLLGYSETRWPAFAATLASEAIALHNRKARKAA